MGTNKNRKSYQRSFKEKVVLMSYENKNNAKVEKELDLYKGAIYNWKKSFAKAEKSRTNEDSKQPEGTRVQILENKIKRSELKFQFLKSALKYMAQGDEIIFRFMLENEKKYPIRMMCEAVNFNRQTYYAWKNHTSSRKKTRQELIKKEITIIFYQAKRRYGAPRIKAELQNLGYTVARKTIKKYMKELNLQCKI